MSLSWTCRCHGFGGLKGIFLYGVRVGHMKAWIVVWANLDTRVWYAFVCPARLVLPVRLSYRWVFRLFPLVSYLYLAFPNLSPSLITQSARTYVHSQQTRNQPGLVARSYSCQLNKENKNSMSPGKIHTSCPASPTIFPTFSLNMVLISRYILPPPSRFHVPLGDG